MAQVIWAEPALNDLDAIADYIALDNPAAVSAIKKRGRQRLKADRK
jgi:toxin ParE1/3/4